MRENTVFHRAKREATLAFLLWLAAGTYTVGYCYQTGYKNASELHFVLGMPDWVFWGVLAPWMASLALSILFAYGYMTDEDLGAEAEDPGQLDPAETGHE